MIGAEVALLFEGGDATRPLIVGRIVEPARRSSTPNVVRDGEHVRITGEERIELRCGKATIIMEKDGHITIRGTYVTSHASAANRIRGGSVNLN
jgi:phage gp45-like